MELTSHRAVCTATKLTMKQAHDWLWTQIYLTFYRAMCTQIYLMKTMKLMNYDNASLCLSSIVNSLY